jgi:hypothetical protein
MPCNRPKEKNPPRRSAGFLARDVLPREQPAAFQAAFQATTLRSRRPWSSPGGGHIAPRSQPVAAELALRTSTVPTRLAGGTITWTSREQQEELLSDLAGIVPFATVTSHPQCGPPATAAAAALLGPYSIPVVPPRRQLEPRAWRPYGVGPCEDGDTVPTFDAMADELSSSDESVSCHEPQP